ncbi:hypothetical protein [Luteococcus peritonei]|uniref:Restriction endonuclease n=1 Tax=Luteococcus peritonei TaxID=88874 RepID=A0ABW4RUA2_9ACTN
MALPEINQQAVQAAIAEFDQLGREAFLAKYGFRHAREYYITENGNRYDSKAIVGAAAGFMPGGAPVTYSEFSGGAATVVPLLTSLGFRVTRDPDRRPTQDATWDLQVGESIRRVELHERFGGSGQNGITASSTTPNVFLFSAASSGHQHGYFDQWEGEYFYYTGDGQKGDQQFVRGNRSILQHVEDGKALRLFNGARGTVTYAGEFELADEQPWIYRQAPESGGGPLRRVIVFRLAPVLSDRQAANSAGDIGRTFDRRNDEVSPAAADPAAPDRDAVERGLRSHRSLENLLADAITERDLEALEPEVQDPPFDVAWKATDGTINVVEVKSTTPANQTAQLRRGLGQVLDYDHTLRQRGHTQIQPILFIEAEPAGDHWQTLCARHGVKLAWPEVLAQLF